jgi:hypothetical protein
VCSSRIFAGTYYCLGVRTFMTESSAHQAEAAWLAVHELTEEKRRDEASDWGTGIAIYECDLKS